MVTHSSILAWEIPWTEGPDGLESTELQRVEHDWATQQQQQQIFQVINSQNASNYWRFIRVVSFQDNVRLYELFLIIFQASFFTKDFGKNVNGQNFQVNLKMRPSTWSGVIMYSRVIVIQCGECIIFFTTIILYPFPFLDWDVYYRI